VAASGKCYEVALATSGERRACEAAAWPVVSGFCNQGAKEKNPKTDFTTVGQSLANVPDTRLRLSSLWNSNEPDIARFWYGKGERRSKNYLHHMSSKSALRKPQLIDFISFYAREFSCIGLESEMPITNAESWGNITCVRNSLGGKAASRPQHSSN
jgi:hypothetical protein